LFKIFFAGSRTQFPVRCLTSISVWRVPARCVFRLVVPCLALQSIVRVEVASVAQVHIERFYTSLLQRGGPKVDRPNGGKTAGIITKVPSPTTPLSFGHSLCSSPQHPQQQIDGVQKTRIALCTCAEERVSPLN
ncbi:unnamed protein product, partial [Pylaiella littoralis]